MRRELRLFVAAYLVCATTGCRPSDSTGPGARDAAISSDAEAKAAFGFLKAAAEFVDQRVPVNLGAGMSVEGSAGSASVTGRKTSSSTNSFSSSSTTRQTDIQVQFTQFKADVSAMTVSGGVRWFDYYYSRTACSSTTCASASDHSEALEGSSISVSFEFNGTRYSDQIDVDASSGSDTSSWSVTLTTRAGQRFTFTHW